MVRFVALSSLILGLFLCASPAGAQVRLQPAFPFLSFDSPVDIQHAPGRPSRLYVVEQDGLIRTVERVQDVTSSQEFLDISDRVKRSTEEGLLGLAFHPNFEFNGRFFVYYTTMVGEERRARLSSFEVDAADSSTADPLSEEILLDFEQPYPHHNAGQIRFGPDGYLYVSVGDGGGFSEERGTGQDLSTLLGAILRIDVDEESGYAIPPDNPFAANDDGFREEIFAYGFRNPWRFDLDVRSNHDDEDVRLWVGDVGAGSLEEVNLVEKGLNYGWSRMEGSLCKDPPVDCQRSDLTAPVWEYGRDLGRAIIGGLIYRGDAIPWLRDRFVYGDFGSGRVWAIAEDADRAWSNVELLHADSLRIHAFGEEPDGELLMAAVNNGAGKLYRLVPSDDGSSGEQETPPKSVRMDGNFPNPFSETTQIIFTLLRPGHARLTIHDALGREVEEFVQLVNEIGEQRLRWDGTDRRGRAVPNGLYLYRLRFDDIVVGSGQMIVVR